MEAKNNHINYIEFKTNNIKAVKAFYNKVFDWVFTDFGPDYTAFSNSGLQGGFEQSDEAITIGPLVVLYHEDLDLIKAAVIDAGGSISKDIFAFPGGSRFHFLDPSGNELAVWSDIIIE